MIQLKEIATYTNTENHPATIRSRVIPRDGQSGSASVPAPRSRKVVEEESESSGSETEMEAPKVTMARKKGETAEERRVRKAGVKEERAVSRLVKIFLVCADLADRPVVRRRNRIKLRLAMKDGDSLQHIRRW
jgi:hypothetical protein